MYPILSGWTSRTLPGRRFYREAQKIAAAELATVLHPVHLLYGLSVDKSGNASQILLRLGISEALLEEKILGAGKCLQRKSSDGSELPMSDESKSTVERAWEVAREAGGSTVETGHLLLGLLPAQGCYELFAEFESDPVRLEEKVRALISSSNNTG